LFAQFAEVQDQLEFLLRRIIDDSTCYHRGSEAVPNAWRPVNTDALWTLLGDMASGGHACPHIVALLRIANLGPHYRGTDH
jgi:hypothetical protein